jgi:hypothetical protein
MNESHGKVELKGWKDGQEVEGFRKETRRGSVLLTPGKDSVLAHVVGDYGIQAVYQIDRQSVPGFIAAAARHWAAVGAIGSFMIGEAAQGTSPPPIGPIGPGPGPGPIGGGELFAYVNRRAHDEMAAHVEHALRHTQHLVHHR